MIYENFGVMIFDTTPERAPAAVGIFPKAFLTQVGLMSEARVIYLVYSSRIFCQTKKPL
jgi:hypothetical protein